VFSHRRMVLAYRMVPLPAWVFGHTASLMGRDSAATLNQSSTAHRSTDARTRRPALSRRGVCGRVQALGFAGCPVSGLDDDAMAVSEVFARYWFVLIGYAGIYTGWLNTDAPKHRNRRRRPAPRPGIGVWWP